MHTRRGPVAALIVAVAALALLASTGGSALAHARFAHAEPAAGSTLDGAPFVLTAWFTQELTSRSAIRVIDAGGVQVDLGDGRVNLDDPDRKVMLVSLPHLPEGTYTVEIVAESAEDGHAEPTSFTFAVGAAPAADQPAAAPDPEAVEGTSISSSPDS